MIDCVNSSPILSVRHLTTRLQIGDASYSIVDDLSFDLHLGKTLAIVGESGCGKSMTALSLMRILPSPPALPSEGEALYRGENLLTLSEKQMRRIRGGKIAMIFQDPSNCLNPVYSIGDQLLESVKLHHDLNGFEAKERVIQSLQEVGIPSAEERLNDYPHQLSGGLKQRVMIAMALIGEPDILIADEPTTALDVTIQAQVLELIRTLQRKRGMAVLLITHDMGIVADFADEVIVMYASQEVERGKILDLFDHMAHPYTQGLFKSRVSLAAPGTLLIPIKGSVPSLTHYPKGCHFHPRCPYVMEKCLNGDIPHFKLYHNRPQTLNFDSARQSSIEALHLERGSPFPRGKGDEESRLSKVAASQNSKFGADCGIPQVDHRARCLLYEANGISQEE